MGAPTRLAATGVCYLAAEPVVFWNSWHTPVFNLDLVALPRARVTR